MNNETKRHTVNALFRALGGEKLETQAQQAKKALRDADETIARLSRKYPQLLTK